MKSTLALAIAITAAIANYDCEAAAMGEIEPDMNRYGYQTGTSDTSDTNSDNIPDRDEAAPENMGCLPSGSGCIRDSECCSDNCKYLFWTVLICD